MLETFIYVVIYILLTIVIQYIVKIKTNFYPDNNSKYSELPSFYRVMIISQIEDSENIYKAFDKFSDSVKDIRQRLFIYVGEDLKDNNIVLKPNFFNKLLKTFNPENIFLGIGNSTCKENINKNSNNYKLSKNIEKLNINKNINSESLFYECGYYRKNIQNSRCEIICLNSFIFFNPDKNNQCVNKQINKLTSDLQQLYNNNKYVYIISPHNIILDNEYKKNQENLIWSKIDKKFKKTIRGFIFSYNGNYLNSFNCLDSSCSWNIPPFKGNTYIDSIFPLNTSLQLTTENIKNIND